MAQQTSSNGNGRHLPIQIDDPRPPAFEAHLVEYRIKGSCKDFTDETGLVWDFIVRANSIQELHSRMAELRQYTRDLVSWLEGRRI